MPLLTDAEYPGIGIDFAPEEGRDEFIGGDGTDGFPVSQVAPAREREFLDGGSAGRGRLALAHDASVPESSP